jgi:hypothetical protein
LGKRFEVVGSARRIWRKWRQLSLLTAKLASRLFQTNLRTSFNNFFQFSICIDSTKNLTAIFGQAKNYDPTVIDDNTHNVADNLCPSQQFIAAKVILRSWGQKIPEKDPADFSIMMIEADSWRHPTQRWWSQPTSFWPKILILGVTKNDNGDSLNLLF